jgi:hypothetical protein
MNNIKIVAVFVYLTITHGSTSHWNVILDITLGCRELFEYFTRNLPEKND